MINTSILILTTFEKIFFYSYYILSSLFYIIFSLITIALFTVVERKIMAALQKRKGPNVHGVWGSLQAFADGLKLLLKEDFVPSTANAFLFRAAPIYTFFIALSSWAVLPFSISQAYFFSNLGILYIFALSSLGVYGIILSGWASNSKYSFLGSLRSAAQMISYEVSLGFIIITLCMLCGSLSLNKFVLDQLFFWFVIPFFPLFFIFFISIVAETNRAPFDLPEAEAELVSGYNVEYGGISFALFFLAEYSNIILMSTLLVLLFLGGWWPLFGIPFFSVLDTAFNFYFIFWLSFKVQIILGIFVWLRVSFPRYRYDQLMFLGWNVLLPFSLSLFFSYSVFLFYYDCLPAYHFYNHPNYIYYCNPESENSESTRFFYQWDRLHELDYVESSGEKENVALADINNYKDEIKKKIYFFERTYWQKLFFLDIPKKYDILFSEINSDSKIIRTFFKISTFGDLAIKQEFSKNPASFLHLMSFDKDNPIFCSQKQCFTYFFDPFFSISDIYAKGFQASHSNNLLNPQLFLAAALLKDCHNTWEFLNNIVLDFMGLNKLDIYKNFDFTKTLFYSYNLKSMNPEELRQPALSLQVLVEKYRSCSNIASDHVLESSKIRDEIYSSILSLKTTKLSEHEETNLDSDVMFFKTLWKLASTIVLEDAIPEDKLVIQNNKFVLYRLKEKLESFNEFFSKNKNMLNMLSKSRASESSGSLTVEITIKTKSSQ